MYKLIIVDDEEEVRKGIIQKIEWAKFHFEIAGEAENGREALDLIEENIPDIVITDITMPLMDGMELAAILKEHFPTVKTVILTGFDDFKFAQQAIKYGVADYILKPVLPKDIYGLLEKLKNQIDNEIAQKEDIVKLRSYYNESLPVIRDRFLTRLITGRPDENEIKNRIASYGLNLAGNTFVVAVVDIDTESLKNNIFEENDMELVKFAILNITKEILAAHPHGEAFYNDDKLIIIKGYKDCERTSVLNKSFSFLEEIRQTADKYLRVILTIGLGTTCDSLVNLREAYTSAMTALDYKLLMGGGRVIFIEDLEPQNSENIVFDDSKVKALISGIKFGGPNEITTAVDALFDDITGINTSFRGYQLYLMEIASTINRIARNFQIDAVVLFGDGLSIYEEIIKLKTITDVRNWIKEICLHLMKNISCKRQNTTELLLEKAKDYIINNYGDDSLSIQKVADHLHISPSYLSLIFKKDAGITFLKYLVAIRLDAAKELLLSSDLKTAEIAEKIGYPDVNYFSYFFKKNFGTSPREYRNQFMQKKES